MTGRTAARYPATRPLVAGIAALFLLVGGLGTWGATARLAGAVVASGEVRVDADRVVVQHPEGGPVAAVLVGEGDLVTSGQVLIRLDGRRLATQMAAVEDQLREIAARKARLLAERDAMDMVPFPARLARQAVTDPRVADVLAAERRLFRVRRDAHRQEGALLGEKSRQVRHRLRGLEAVRLAVRAQSALVDAELRDQDRLLRSGLARAGRVRDLRREAAGLAGRIGQLEAEMADLRGQAAAFELSKLHLATRRREEAAKLLRDIEFREIELQARKFDLEDRRSRLELRAPVTGVIHDLRVDGGQVVVRAGEPLLQIVPKGRPLMISARIDRARATSVRAGQEVVLRFPGFDRTTAPDLRGRVAHVSADALRDPATGAAFFGVEIIPDDDALREIGDRGALPGMLAEVFIQTGARTPVAYLAEPFRAVLDRAMRE